MLPLKPLCLILFSLLALLSSCGGGSLEIMESWDRLQKKLEKGVSLLDRYLVAEDPGLLDKVNVFSKDKGALPRDLEKVVEDAVEILDVSELREYKDDINELLDESYRTRGKISELRFDREMASADKRKDCVVDSGDSPAIRSVFAEQ